MFPWEIARRKIMYPTRRDIVQASELSCELTVAAAVIFRKEFRDESKATAKYLSAIGGSVSGGFFSYNAQPPYKIRHQLKFWVPQLLSHKIGLLRSPDLF